MHRQHCPVGGGKEGKAKASGKRQKVVLEVADRLIPLFPPHECYVEVFAGGAALYFMRPQAAPVLQVD